MNTVLSYTGIQWNRQVDEWMIECFCMHACMHACVCFHKQKSDMGIAYGNVFVTYENRY